jgi:hypothetical protein
MAAKCRPNRIHLLVGSKSWPSRRRAAVVQAQDLGRDELAVEPVAGEERADRGDHQPQAVDGLAAMDRDAAQTQRARGCERQPDEASEESFHHW